MTLHLSIWSAAIAKSCASSVSATARPSRAGETRAADIAEPELIGLLGDPLIVGGERRGNAGGVSSGQVGDGGEGREFVLDAVVRRCDAEPGGTIKPCKLRRIDDQPIEQQRLAGQTIERGGGVPGVSVGAEGGGGAESVDGDDNGVAWWHGATIANDAYRGAGVRDASLAKQLRKDPGVADVAFREAPGSLERR